MATKKEANLENPANNALVVGGGVAGIRAALDLAEAGYMVKLVEAKPNLGGILMQLDQQFPTNDCGICKMLPTLMRNDISECCLRRDLTHPNIDVFTDSSVKNLSGSAGNFSADITRKPEFVDPVKCISCGKCEEVCPVEVPNEFNDQLDTRKAIFQPYPLPNPNNYTLDINICTQCGDCVKICPTDAIDLKAKEQNIVQKVGAVILAPGLQVFDPSPYRSYNYGNHPNVLTSIDFERVYSGLGPYSGLRKIVRPSDNKTPKNLGFIQCVGSRNTQIGHQYCSYACCMYSLKEAMLAKEAHPEMDVTIFYMDMRAFGKDYHEYYLKAIDLGINFVRCRVPEVQSILGNDDLMLSIVKESGQIINEEYEMVILAVGLEAPSGVDQLANACDIKLDDEHFSINDEYSILATAKPGIYVCGGFTGPKDIPESITEASAAAGLAQTHLERIAEPEKESEGKEETKSIIEKPNVGVILCQCGDELKDSLDFDELTVFSKGLSGVELVEKLDYLCLNPDKIKEIIEGSNGSLDSLIIGACTPYHLEVKFKNSAKSAGIKPDNVELINLRERLAWVCSENDDKTMSTTTAKGQLAVAHERLYSGSNFDPKIEDIPVEKNALVVGGGLTGMTSAVTLAENNIQVDLIERGSELGGNLKDIYQTLQHDDVQKFLGELIDKVEKNKNITVHLNTEVSEVIGYTGNFQVTFNDQNSGSYGAIILATGASEYEPTEYLYGQNPKVLTQLELEQVLANKPLNDQEKMKYLPDMTNLKSMVMIQCVGTRNKQRTYCSRVCCSKAIKNALIFKKQNPDIKIFILYQDIMTYGLQESYYLEARRAGIEFLRYEPEEQINVTQDKSGKIKIKHFDELLEQEITIEPDILVLSTGIVPNNSGLEPFVKLGIEYTQNYFIQEANIKFRPVDTLVDGIFIAGLAHSPRLISESIVQGQAAAGRAMTILNKSMIQVRDDVSEVITRKCSGCEACVSVCPYHARVMDMDEKVAVVIPALCQACGACAMVCPNGAAVLRGFRRGQIYGMIDAAVFS
jgi:heterodisulfide reductase subunit A